MNAKQQEPLYLVTGAAGFLGGTVCRRLVERGRQVRALVLPGDKAREFIPDQVEITLGDLTDQASLDRFFTARPGQDLYVIHCASIVTVNPDYSQKVMDVNVGGTRNIIRCCLKTPGFQKLVYVSFHRGHPGTAQGQKNHRGEPL